MLYNNAVIPDVCTHIHQDLFQGDTLRPLPASARLL